MSRVTSINNKRVVDAKRRIHLNVLAEDVEKARSKEPDACAAALACTRQMFAMSALVHATRTYVEYEDHWVRYITPAALRTEILVFDRAKKFQPDLYVLNPPHTKENNKAQRKRRKKVAEGAVTKTKPTGGRPKPKHVVHDVRHMATYKG